MTERANDWEELIADWRGVTARSDADALRALVTRQHQRMTLAVIAEVAVSVVFISAAATMLLRAPGAASTLFAINVVVMLIAAWTSSLWSRRGTWQPLGETTAHYLELARLRCRRRLEALTYGWVMLAGQIVFVGSWVLWGPGPSGGGPRPGALSILLPVAVIAAFVCGMLWIGHRTRRELAELELMAKAIAEP
jgi:hypothetical protein